MKEINNNYMSYSSFAELREIANVKSTNIDISTNSINISYFGYLKITNYLRNFYLGSPIINGEKNYNNSYSNFVKKYNTIYDESWISTTASTVEEIQKNTILTTTFSIICEFIVIAIPIFIRKLS